MPKFQIFRMDIIRNVGIREPVPQGSSKITDTDINSLAMKLADTKLNRNSLPNILFKEPDSQRIANGNGTPSTAKTAISTKMSVQTEKNVQSELKPNDDGGTGGDVDGDGDDEEECAISGRLEIRVIQQNQEPKISPNREESIYFDAEINGQNADDAKVSRKLVNKIYTTHATERNTETVDANCELATDETAFYSAATTAARLQDDAQKSSDVARLNLDNSNPNSGDGDNRLAGNGLGLIATTIGITEISSTNDDNAADSFVTAGNTLAKLSNVIG